MELVEKEKKYLKLKQTISIIIGCLLIAIGFHFFLKPANLTLGGGAGLAIVLSKYIPLSTGLILMGINIVLFVIGFSLLGNAFGVKTIVASFLLTLIIWAFEILIPVQKSIIKEPFMELLVAVLLYGTGIGIVLNNYASTGGSDIVAKILHKYFGINLGRGCQITDFIITLGAGIAYGKEVLVYSLVGVILNGIVIDATINGLNSSKLCIINTNKPEIISSFIVEKIKRTANIIPAKGAYFGKDQSIIETVLSNREFIRLKEYMTTEDPNAFIVVANASETLGLRWRRMNE